MGKRGRNFCRLRSKRAKPDDIRAERFGKRLNFFLKNFDLFLFHAFIITHSKEKNKRILPFIREENLKVDIDKFT